LYIEIRKPASTPPADIPRGVLLSQGEILCGSGERVEVFSDDSWQVSRDGVNWRQAFCAAHPPMGAFGDPWRGGRRIQYPAILWYRLELPPGSSFLEKPDIRGDYSLYINGSEIPKPALEPLNIRQYCSQGKNIIAVRVTAESGNDGIIHPLRITVEPEEISLRDWRDMGLDWYSGRGLYTNTFRFSGIGKRDHRKWILDPGVLNFCGEIWLNGKRVHESPWPPFACDVTEFLKEGDNTVTIIAANLLANQMVWNIYDDAVTNPRSIWWHRGSILREAEKLVSGLCGPVQLIPYEKVRAQIPIGAE